MTAARLVPGHGLQSEGAPMLKAGCCGGDDTDGKRNLYDRIGHGVCSCGVMGPCLESTAKRKVWHRQHKDEVAAQ